MTVDAISKTPFLTFCLWKREEEGITLVDDDGGALFFIPPARMERIFSCDPAVAIAVDVEKTFNGDFLLFVRMNFDDDEADEEDEASATIRSRIRIVEHFGMYFIFVYLLIFRHNNTLR